MLRNGFMLFFIGIEFALSLHTLLYSSLLGLGLRTLSIYELPFIVVFLQKEKRKRVG